jgi:hypothetical protein
MLRYICGNKDLKTPHADDTRSPTAVAVKRIGTPFERAPAKLPRSVAIPAKACANTFDRDCTTRPYSLQELEVPFRQREGFRQLSEPVEAQTPWCHCTMAAGDRSVQ